LLLNVLVAFAATFLLGYGWYFLLAGWGEDPVSIGNLLYLAAAMPLAAAVMAARALGNEQEERVSVPGEQVSRGVHLSTRALGGVLFVALATVVGYQTLPPVPPEDPAVSPPQRPSCPGYLDQEVAAFEGRGSRITPAFDVSGYWGMENASTGYGTISWTVVDEEGDVPYGTDGPFGAGNSVGGGEYAHGGTFRLKIEADDDARYAVVICEGEGSGGGSGGSAPQAAEPPR